MLYSQFIIQSVGGEDKDEGGEIHSFLSLGPLSQLIRLQRDLHITRHQEHRAGSMGCPLFGIIITIYIPVQEIANMS